MALGVPLSTVANKPLHSQKAVDKAQGVVLAELRLDELAQRSRPTEVERFALVLADAVRLDAVDDHGQTSRDEAQSTSRRWCRCTDPEAELVRPSQYI